MANAYFLNMVRDGRDVAASTLERRKGYKKTLGELGASWASTHLKFRMLVGDPSVNAYEVRYETLVTQPEKEIKNICSFLGLPFKKEMLKFYKKSLTVYSATHLSMDRISRPVDSSRVGRWKKELTKQQLIDFYSTAKKALIEFGYINEGSNDVNGSR